MMNYSKNTNTNNNKNDDEYVYDINFEKYVDNIVNSDDENDKKNKINIIITEKKFYDIDYIRNSINNNRKPMYNKGNIYTNRNLNRNYINRNNLDRNNNVQKIVKKVRFSDEIKIIDDNINTFREDSPKSIVVNFNQCNDDVRNKKFNDFIPNGKYVFNKSNY